MTGSTQRKIVIIGGGITGMAAAYTVQQQARAQGIDVSFVLVESSQRLGGKIATEQVDGFTIEGGPDCFIRDKPWAGSLCLELGLEKEMIGTNDAQRKIFVLNHGRLTPLPDGVMLIVPTRVMPFVTSSLISWPGKIRMGMDLLIPAYRGDADESVGSFVRRRLGNEALDKIAEPLMGGIHVSDPEKQSLLASFPRFRNIEKKHGSLIKGMLAERRARAKNGKTSAAPSRLPSSMFLTLRNGLGQMVRALEDHLVDGRVLRGTAVTGLAREASGDYTVTLDSGEQIQAAAVVLATPAYVSAKLLAGAAPEVSQMLSAIRYVSTATISLAYRKADIRKPFVGHGLLVPRKEGRQISACTWTSFKFNHRAPEDALLLRCFAGGPGHEEQVDWSDEELVSVARHELKDMLAIDAEPVVTRVYRWPKANPQYDVGHLDRVKEMKTLLERCPGLYLAGGAYEGVGIPDCIHQGQEAAKKALQNI